MTKPTPPINPLALGRWRDLYIFDLEFWNFRRLTQGERDESRALLENTLIAYMKSLPGPHRPGRYESNGRPKGGPRIAGEGTND